MSSGATRYDDPSHRRHPSPSRSRRDYSPDYHSGGSRGPYITPAIPPPPIVPVGPYEGYTPFYASPDTRGNNNNSLQVPSSPARPRSTPPYARGRDRDRRDGGKSRERSRRREKDDGRDDEHERPKSPIGKARHVLQHTFSDSNSGLGVGVLGAIIGGLAAREASEAAARHGRHGSEDKSHQGAALLSTVVGAAVGGFGANALEKRIEMSRNKAKDEQERWERKFGREEKDGGRREREVEREKERRDRDAEEGRAGGRGRRREYEDEDSEPDYVYDRRPSRRRRSEEEMRYRP